MSDYIQELEAKLQASRERVRQGREMQALKASAPTLLEIIDGEIALIANRMNQDKPLDYDAYLSAHGEAKGIRRIRDLINSKEADATQAAQEVTALTSNLKQLKDDAKQQARQ